jgi:hypothetical protein
MLGTDLVEGDTESDFNERVGLRQVRKSLLLLIVGGNYAEVRIQKSEFRMRTPATRFEDLAVWQEAHPCCSIAQGSIARDVSGSSQLLEEVSQRLEAYSCAILDSEF